MERREVLLPITVFMMLYMIHLFVMKRFERKNGLSTKNLKIMSL